MRIIIAEYHGTDSNGFQQVYEVSINQFGLGLDIATEMGGHTYYECYTGETITEMLDCMDQDAETEGYDKNAREELEKIVQNQRNLATIKTLSTMLLEFHQGKFN